MGNSIPSVCKGREADLEHEDRFDSLGSSSVFTKPKSQSPQDSQVCRLLLISDSIERHELLIRAVSDNVIVVPVKFDNWTGDDLIQAIIARAGQPAKQYASVGILGHGNPSELCILQQIDDGSTSFRDIILEEAHQDFLRFLASYVIAQPEFCPRTCAEYCIDLLSCRLIDALGVGKELSDFIEAETGVRLVGTLDDNGPIASPASFRDAGLQNLSWYFAEDLAEIWDPSKSRAPGPMLKNRASPCDKQQCVQIFRKTWNLRDPPERGLTGNFI
eukprot:TRINITY_DN11611_c0_g2_i1.p1 TRINITY_DN11611_c0_g2~~TRINITY_DN11611_c0_g2_i1.p1  ORF type:complete len:274 (-),score=27.87 TRINITY_DN11611_c0_g2_i1:97-918(-)